MGTNPWIPKQRHTDHKEMLNSLATDVRSGIVCVIIIIITITITIIIESRKIKKGVGVSFLVSPTDNYLRVSFEETESNNTKSN